MKNTLLVSSLFFVITLSAQIPKHEIGFEGGPNFLYGWQKSKLTSSPQWEEKRVSKGSLGSLGMLYLLNFTKHHAFRTGLTFELLGEKNGKGDTAFYNAAPCFTLPLLYQYTLPIKKLAVYGNAGFSFMYYGSLDWVVTTGIGFKYRILPKLSIGIEGRNNLWLHSFAGVYSNSVWGTRTNTGGSYTYSDFRTHTTLLFSMAFKLGKKQIE